MITIINKKILLPIVLMGATGITFFGVTQIHAQNVTPLNSLASVIAQKFNLNETDVENTISDYRKTHMENMMKNRLDKLVTDGKITSDQETAIINEINSLSGQNKMSDFNSWLKSQNIDPSIFHRFGKLRMGIRHSP